MSDNPILATVLEIQADAQRLMGNAVSITWDASRSQESHSSRGPRGLGFTANAPEVLSKGARMKLMEVSPVLAHEFQLALQKRLRLSLGMVSSDPSPARTIGAWSLEPGAWGLVGDWQLSDNVDMVRKVRTGKIESVLEGVCETELGVMVGLQIECLRFYKAPSNPFSAENFAAALLQALETAIPDELQQQSILEVLVPSFAQAVRSGLRQYAETMSFKLQTLAAAVERDGQRRQDRHEQQFENTVPAEL